ncbi:hypothetical protein ABWI00_10230 [Algihabitans albus]|uniref:hypothetical protein n=1 Tax=Algihabitans albus TaxID=2164067 RepID=UPI0035CEB347
MDLLDELSDLPEDPELAFVEFERRKRKKLEENLWSSQGYLIADVAMEYLFQVMAFHDAFDLKKINQPNISRNSENFDSEFKDFLDSVTYQTMFIQALQARRLSSVRVIVSLTPENRQEIQGYIEKIRDIVRPIELRPGKKEAILKRLDELSNEIERDRTKVEALTATSLEIATEIDRHTKLLDRAKGFLDKIEHVIASAKELADQAKLGRREAPKLIEGPKSKEVNLPEDSEIKGEETELDDDIHF